MDRQNRRHRRARPRSLLQGRRFQITERPSDFQLKLHTLVARRRQLVDLHVQDSNRFEAARDKAVKDDIEQTRNMLEYYITAIEKRSTISATSNPDAKRRIEFVTSVRHRRTDAASASSRTSRSSATPTASSSEHFVGVAPYNRDSGKSSKLRSIRSSRASVRFPLLFMAALHRLTLQFPVIEFVYRSSGARLAQAKFLTACVRKTLTILRAR